jgi:serine/threonine protein kinase
VIRDDGPVSPAQAADIGLCLLDALQAAHAAGIVHRDVKPGNVILRDDGRVTLTDFGIASTTGDPSITSTGLLLGSPAYISPERARGGPPQPSSDLWSLGATLYTAVEGHPPFDRSDAFATLTAVVTDEPEPCELAGPILCDAIAGLLEKDPERRHDATEVRARLYEVRDDPDSQHAGRRKSRRNRLVRTGGHTVALRPVDSISRARRVTALAILALIVFGASATLSAVLTAH